MLDIKYKAILKLSERFEIDSFKETEHIQLEDNLYQCDCNVVLKGETKDDGFDEDQITKITFNYKLNQNNKVETFNFVEYFN